METLSMFRADWFYFIEPGETYREEANEMNEKDPKSLEDAFAKALEKGDLHKESPSAAAVRRLIPPYEARMQTEQDPIVEETKAVRRLAEEVDDRYDRYLDKIPKKDERNR